MSANDPRSELQDVIHRCDRGDIPEKARHWALAMLDVVETNLRFVQTLESMGHTVPEEVLREGFRRIQCYALGWIQEARESDLVWPYGHELDQ